MSGTAHQRFLGQLCYFESESGFWKRVIRSLFTGFPEASLIRGLWLFKSICAQQEPGDWHDSEFVASASQFCYVDLWTKPRLW